MKFDIVKKIILDSIPENVNISSIDFKEGSDNLTIKINWEVLKPLAPTVPLDGYANIFNENPIEIKKPISNGKKISTLFDETGTTGSAGPTGPTCATGQATESTKQKPSGSFRLAAVADGYEAKPIDELAKEQKNKQKELYKIAKESYENVENYNYSSRKAQEDFEVACYIYQKQFGGEVVKSPMGNCSVVINGNKIPEIDITFFANKFLKDIKCKIDKLVEEKEKKKNEPKPVKSRFGRILDNIKQIKDIILHG